ncbi:MAG: S-layer homology domain-containing protein [Oscillospiraceae bacterium]|nr:S-layer homology domain-containing protein [Oscillospiraceae bacterium]
MNTKKLLALALSAALAVMPYTSAFAFADCSDESVTRLAKLGVISGDENGNFNPDKYATRAEFATMMALASGAGEMSAVEEILMENNFTDISEDYWGYKYILYCGGNLFISGYEDGSFRPNDDITLEQALNAVLASIGYDALLGDKSAVTLASEYGLADANDDGGRSILKIEAAEIINTALDLPMYVLKGIDFSSGSAQKEFYFADGNADENGNINELKSLYTTYFN